MRLLDFRTLLVILMLSILAPAVNAQVPEIFNYQGVARDNDRNPIASTNLNVKIAVLLDSPTGLVLWEEQHSILTSAEGVFTLKVGDPAASKTGGTLSAFSDINWQIGSKYLRPSIEYQSTWYEMDASQLVTVPYALLAKKAETGQFPINGDVVYLPDGSLSIGSSDAGGSMLAVVSNDDLSEDALFEVKRADGQTVFAVYPEAVRMYVAKGDPLGKAPGTRGGFVVGGFDKDKATPINDLFWLTPDSVRFYIDDTQTGKAPGTRGGFAVGGFDRDKATPGPQYMSISGSNIPDAIPPSSQILFYPRKDALLAGYIEVEDQSMVGENSTSLGFLNKASGQYSQAFGYMSEASADYSMAVGKNAIASGNSAYAIGEDAEALGDNSYAFGQSAIANSVNSLSMGFYSSAGGSSIALGKQAKADGSEATAIGMKSTANAFQSTSIGPESTASDEAAVALGHSASATKRNSIALGYSAQANGLGSNSLGYNANTSGDYSTAFSISNASGSFSLAACNGNASGVASAAIGWGTNAQAYKSVVLGSGGLAFGSTGLWVDSDPIFVVGNSDNGTSNAMEILKNGNVGIGADPVDYKLEVGGTIKASFFTTTSDITFKTNINQIESASNKIMRIEGVSFNFRNEEYPDMGLPEGSHYGFIAQDLKEILPDLVNEGSDGKLSVAYTEMIPILLEAFKEQEIIIAEKQVLISNLETENADIRARLDALEAVVGSMLEKQ